MTHSQIDFAAAVFRDQCSSAKMTEWERDMLKQILSAMPEPERAGTIAAIIKIMIAPNGTTLV